MLRLSPQNDIRNMNIDLQEIFCCHDWAIEPIAGQQLYNALMEAIATYRDDVGARMEKTAGYFLRIPRHAAGATSEAAGKSLPSGVTDTFAGKLYVGDIHRIENRLYWRDEELAEDDQIVNVVVIEGAVTRNGGACTYGSKDHRDQIMYANTIPQVVGHLFLINTPGGMVGAMPDYTLAFDDCRAWKKPTVSLIDGTCYSAGVWIACQTDRVIARNPEDGIGCIGAMSCCELAPHGSINAITQERLIILVGKASPDKNREALEASHGNDELMQAEADKNTGRFHQIVKDNRPMVTDDLLTGKTYAAREVMGKLVDEIGDMDRAIECLFQLSDGTLTAARDVEVIPDEETAVRDHEAEPAPDENPEDEASVITPQNVNDMTDEEKKAADAQEAQSGEAAVQQSSEQAPAQEEAPAQEAAAQEEQEAQEEQHSDAALETDAPAAEEVPSQESDASQLSAGATEDCDGDGELAKVTAALHSAESLLEQRDNEIAELKGTLATLAGIAEERDAALKERDEISASLEKAGLDYAEQGKALSDAEVKIAEHVATIENLTKQVAALKADVKELSEKDTPMVDASAGIPADNGTGHAPVVQKRITRENMSYEHVREVANERRAACEAAKKKK